ncbi:polysaccharide deacetylase [Rhizobiaceae bacterium n13]|uniref:Polysaccharide deacetylase n=1 Tax=Ferirhizobium litorale TaxID=2927786 RepID=A0AAE3QBI5_9HYPH|nr:polysaccharide deacetylase [Fererhizobium litorale]MDI7860800.1 polysaccharide deacetylase [Fererhizobium litorale]MDI7920948.1 polysaccharide deacetylase [Fererhizobium litorale]
MLRPLPFLALALCLTHGAVAADAERPKQLVLISFDGAHDNALWEKSLEMARRNNAHFTYFLSCTFLMSKQQKAAYRAPGHKRGRSNVGFAQSDEEIRTRLGHIWRAHLDGHDIGSHACGHFDGKDWSRADWKREFDTFRETLKDAWKNAGIPEKEPQRWAEFATTAIRGFRAPYLSTSPGLTEAQKDEGFAYDASLVTKGPAMPSEQRGIMEFGLPLIAEGPSARPVIGMDYNLFVRHSAGFENRAKSAEFEERTIAAYRAAFHKQYAGERIPLQLGFHFVEMNGGAYWRALDRFLTEVCNREDVACVSYADAMPLIKERQQKQKAEETSAF